MMFFTHLVLGVFIGLLSLKLNFLNINANINSAILFLTITTISSIIPDIDIATSFISRKTRTATYAISYFFKHRGIIHSILVPIVIFAVIYTINTQIASAILIGYVSHIMIDSLTKTGVQPFLPVTNYRIKGIMRTGGLADFMIFIFLIILIIIMTA